MKEKVKDGKIIILSSYHAKYYAHELTRQVAGDDIYRLSTSLFDASVDLNPHQIGAGRVLCQYWAEKKRKLIVICPASLRKQWATELSEKFNLPTVILDAATVRKQKRKVSTIHSTRRKL